MKKPLETSPSTLAEVREQHARNLGASLDGNPAIAGHKEGTIDGLIYVAYLELRSFLNSYEGMTSYETKLDIYIVDVIKRLFNLDIPLSQSNLIIENIATLSCIKSSKKEQLVFDLFYYISKLRVDHFERLGLKALSQEEGKMPDVNAFDKDRLPHELTGLLSRVAAKVAEAAKAGDTESIEALKAWAEGKAEIVRVATVTECSNRYEPYFHTPVSSSGLSIAALKPPNPLSPEELCELKKIAKNHPWRGSREPLNSAEFIEKHFKPWLERGLAWPAPIEWSGCYVSSSSA